METLDELKDPSSADAKATKHYQDADRQRQCAGDVAADENHGNPEADERQPPNNPHAPRGPEIHDGRSVSAEGLE
jgi:hypothetical protein